MLTTVKLHNFKTFLNTDIRLTDRHLLLGKNSSGKTNFALALRFLAQSSRWDLDVAANYVPGGVSELCNWNLKSDDIEIEVTCSLDFEEHPCEYRYCLHLRRELPGKTQPPQPFALRVAHESLIFSGGGFENVTLLENDGHEARMVHEVNYLSNGETQRIKTRGPQNATMLSKLYELETNPRAIHFRKYVSNWAYYALSPNHMRSGPTQGKEANVVLDESGEQLANAIFHMKSFDEQRYRRVLEHARIIEPSLEAVNFLVTPNQLPLPFVQLMGAPRTSWPGLSDGALRGLAMGLIVESASAFSPPHHAVPCLILIEEPENGIFPGQLRKLFDLFEEWAPAAQFMFTSHSPYFIDMFDARRDSVTIFRRSSGHTEHTSPPPAKALAEDPFTLSMEYSSELFE